MGEVPLGVGADGGGPRSGVFHRIQCVWFEREIVEYKLLEHENFLYTADIDARCIPDPTEHRRDLMSSRPG